MTNRTAMSGCINAARKAGNDGNPTLGQVSRQHQRRILTVGGTFARTDDCHTRLIQATRPRAFYVKRYRRIVNLP